MRDKRKAKKEVANSLVLVLQLGLNIIVPILICTIAGEALTKAYGPKSFTVAGILIGVVAACNGAYRYFKSYLKRLESEKRHD